MSTNNRLVKIEKPVTIEYEICRNYFPIKSRFLYLRKSVFVLFSNEENCETWHKWKECIL